VPLSEEEGELLATMRRVVATAPESDRSHEQQRLRAWLEKDRVSFFRYMTKLAMAERARPALTGAEVDALAVRLADALGAAVARALERHAGPEGRGVILAGPPERGDQPQVSGAGRRDPSPREEPEDFLE
jgi:hypothetical protein